MEKLHVDDTGLLPLVVEAFQAGAARHLKMLVAGEACPDGIWSPVVLQPAQMAALTLLFQGSPGALPALKELIVYEQWTSHAGLRAFLDALAQGALPMLCKLELVIPRSKMQELAIQALASALEARRARGCAGLAYMELAARLRKPWATKGSSAERRLWAVLLPTLESSPLDPVDKGEQTIFDAIMELGAPRLVELTLSGPQAPHCLPHVRGLVSLHFINVDPPLTSALEAALGIADHGEPLLPALREFSVDLTKVDGDVALFESLGRAAAFSGVRKLYISLADRACMQLAGAGKVASALGQALKAGRPPLPPSRSWDGTCRSRGRACGACWGASWPRDGGGGCAGCVSSTQPSRTIRTASPTRAVCRPAP